MDGDRSFRRLTALEQSASTARVLNLLSVHRKPGLEQELSAAPMFSNRLLNRSIIVKHRLRPHEYSQFHSPRPTATKVLLPIDGGDLRVGARFFFVDQKDLDEVTSMVPGSDLKLGSPDRRTLDLIDSLPSLDPFLLREHLRANGVAPARAYFNITDADMARMFDFVRTEITALVALSSGDSQGVFAYASRLVEKLLSNAPDSGFEPLKETLKLSDQEYLDGVFAWRGFLYYKWMLADLSDSIREVLAEMLQTQARGRSEGEALAYLPGAKQRLHANISQTTASVSAMLEVYNKAYAGLTKDGQRMAFREFLLTAPSMFTSLGEQLGAVQHVISFWRYRFPAGRPRLISPSDLVDLFLDFEDSLSFSLAAAA